MSCDVAAIIIMLLNLTFTIKQLFLLGFSYPSHQQYSDMVRAIFNRWPHLQQELSNSQDAIPFPDENLFQECPKTIANYNSGSVGKESYFWQKKG